MTIRALEERINELTDSDIGATITELIREILLTNQQPCAPRTTIDYPLIWWCDTHDRRHLECEADRLLPKRP